MSNPSPATLDIGLQIGQRAPDMVLPEASRRNVRWYSQAGGVPALLLMAGEASANVIREVETALDDAVREQITIHVVGPASLLDAGIQLPILVDDGGRAAGVYGTEGTPMALLLDANLRVRQTMRLVDGSAVATAVGAFANDQRAAQRPPREIALQAPVLTVPHVLTPDECAALMRTWEDDNEATGVEDSTAGARGERLQTKQKRRRDHTVADPQEIRRLTQLVGRRIVPEIRRAFHYPVNRFEGFKIACYTDTDRGFFSAHRDNLSPSTAHRRFGLTLNLNDGYEGGQLRFPEFGPDLYKPPPGGALIFSGSHLHEVLDVTKGRRFVLLSFLYGDDAVRRDPNQPTDHSGHSHG